MNLRKVVRHAIKGTERVRVLAIDPGRMTGYCYAAWKDGKLFFCPFQALDDVEDLYFRIAKFEPKHIIIEDFAFRGGARKGLELFPVQLIGVTRLYYAMHADCTLTVQQPAQGKSYYSDNTLKQLGLYKRGDEHGRDASRHLLQWATFGPGYKYATKGDRNFAAMVGMEAFDV